MQVGIRGIWRRALLVLACSLPMLAMALEDLGEPGYWVKDPNTQCAMFMAGEGGPAENETVTWDGPCVNGLAQGLGVNVVHFDEDAVVYVGSMHQGRWHGFGRLSNYHGDRLTSVYEGRFAKDTYHGMGNQILWFSSEAEFNAYKESAPDGTHHGLVRPAMQRYGLFEDDELVVTCERLADCMAKAQPSMLGRDDVALGILPDTPMRMGLWKLKHHEVQQSAQGTKESNRENSLCLQVPPGMTITEPMAFRLLFPSFVSLTGYTRNGYQCHDQSVEQTPTSLDWHVRCTNEEDVTVKVHQTRKLSATRLESVSTATTPDAQGRELRVQRTTTGEFAGQCPAGMVSQGTLVF